MTWAAKMAVGLETGVPWVMCKEEDAPDPVVSSPILFIQLILGFSHAFFFFFFNLNIFSSELLKHYLSTSVVY